MTERSTALRELFFQARVSWTTCCYDIKCFHVLLIFRTNLERRMALWGRAPCLAFELSGLLASRDKKGDILLILLFGILYVLCENQRLKHRCLLHHKLGSGTLACVYIDCIFLFSCILKLWHWGPSELGWGLPLPGVADSWTIACLGSHL
jgi:hypothetical protein